MTTPMEAWLLSKIEELEANNLIMRELIDSCEDVVASWPKTPHQHIWAREWVRKARKVMG
jgi:hypothetical protein